MIQARNLVPAIGDYSTSEQDTGFTWIDGKTIYKKTINFGTLPNSTSKSVAHGISNLGILIKFEGVASNSSGRRLPLPILYEPSSAAFNTQLDCTNTSITIVTARNQSEYSAYVTLYYTKSN